MKCCNLIENNFMNRAFGWYIKGNILVYRNKKASVQDLLNGIFYYNEKWFKFDINACYDFMEKYQIPTSNVISTAQYIIDNMINIEAMCMGYDENNIKPNFILPRYIDCEFNKNNGWSLKQIGHNKILHKFDKIATAENIEAEIFCTTEGNIVFSSIDYSNITTNIDIKQMIAEGVKFDEHKVIESAADHFIYIGAAQKIPMNIMNMDYIYFSKYVDCEQNKYQGWSLEQISVDIKGRFLFFDKKLATKMQLKNANFFSSKGVYENFDLEEYAWINNFNNVDDAAVHFITKGAYQGKWGRAFKMAPKNVGSVMPYYHPISTYERNTKEMKEELEKKKKQK